MGPMNQGLQSIACPTGLWPGPPNETGENGAGLRFLDVEWSAGGVAKWKKPGLSVSVPMKLLRNLRSICRPLVIVTMSLLHAQDPAAQGIQAPALPEPPRDPAPGMAHDRLVWEQHAEASRQYQMALKYAGDSGGDVVAIDLFRRAAELGYPPAQFTLGTMYAAGRGVSQDDEKALQWYRRSAENGEPRGQFMLGSRFLTGRGLPQNDAEAFRWFQKSAEQEYAPAQFGLGALYESGRGVTQDDGRAIEWLKKAADQGYANAEFTLAGKYAQGRGVPNDPDKAAELLRKAAQHGHIEARRLIDDASVFSSGTGE